ncbi:hypothetical protein [Methanogenium sp. MK-MG]|uniref:hypothetical protein n=1 Tax=Methanogenium sp. MK-MG TaxID=2599926 RepID=UPI0013EBD08A|nr:hypothetical protein [Methanogenium sp. MK-MG]KAF1074506.1 hypothetical protein MKMG_01925 [Methanogenium sp. MK-MG]
MVRKFIPPAVAVSRCIESDHCRWNGDMITSHIVDRSMELSLGNLNRGRDLRAQPPLPGV